MKTDYSIELDFEIDKLTNSIENAISGEVFETLIIEIIDIKKLKIQTGFLIGITR